MTLYIGNKWIRIYCFKAYKISFLNGQSQKSTWTQPSHLVIYKEKSLDFVKTKVTDAVTWYEQFTGLKDVRLAQGRVIEATHMLKEAQDRRRDARLPLAEVQKKLQEFLPELRNTPRDDDRYIQLVKEEHKYLKEAKFLQERLQDAEKDEREAFELLSSFLRSSHEAERAQAERTKYWSLIASIIGTAIGVIGSSINNNHKMKKLQNLVNETSKPEHLQNIVHNQLEDFMVKYSVKDELDRIFDLLKEDRKVQEISAKNIFSDVASTQTDLLIHSSSEEVLDTFSDGKKVFLYIISAFAAGCTFNVLLRS